jgi:hypothetical protein
VAKQRAIKAFKTRKDNMAISNSYEKDAERNLTEHDCSDQAFIVAFVHGLCTSKAIDEMQKNEQAIIQQPVFVKVKEKQAEEQKNQ